MFKELSKTNLKKLSKQAKIIGYSRMNKAQLVQALSQADLTVPVLRQVAKLSGITGYSRMNKAQLLQATGFTQESNEPSEQPTSPQARRVFVQAPEGHKIENLNRGQIRRRRKQYRAEYGPGSSNPSTPGLVTFDKGRIETHSSGLVLVAS